MSRCYHSKIKGKLAWLVVLSVLLAAGRIAHAQPPQPKPAPTIDEGLATKRQSSTNMADIRVDIVPVNPPKDISAELFNQRIESSAPAAMHRDWPVTAFYWAPTELAHQPLYFDDVPLERYGQTLAPRLQTAISGAHFFFNIPALPYKAVLDRPYEPVYTLGYFRPGSPTPCIRQTIPFQADAAAFETATVLALVLLLP